MSESCPSAAPFPSLAERARAVLAGAGEVPSPCISVCRMDEVHDRCVGCLRTRDELRAWRGLDDAGKRLIWGQIAQRLNAQETTV